MSDPILAYNNLFETGTVSATSEDASYPKENAYDWKPFDWWKPSVASGTVYFTVDSGVATPADYWAIYAHSNIDSIQLQESDDNFATVTNVGAAVTPTGGELIFRTFTSSSKRYRRFVITHSAVFSLGIAAVGAVETLTGISLRAGFSPLQRENKLLNNDAQNGNYLGRSVIRNGLRFDVDLDLFDPAVARSAMEAFIDHAEIKPFFFSWDQTNYPDEAVFCELTARPQADYSRPRYMRYRLQFNGVR